MKNKKMIFWIIGFIALGAAFYFLYWKKRDEPGTIIEKITGATPTAWPIKKGESAPEVKKVQEALNRKHNAGLSVDGVLGAGTLAAMEKYYNPGKPFPHLDEFWFKAITK